MTTQITALPTPPSTNDPANFDTRADAFLGQLPTTVTEMNTLAVELNGLASQLALAAEPGGITFAYTFDSTTTDSDPGAGKLRLSSATQNAATVIRADLVDNMGQTVTTLLDQIDDSTSSEKGYLRLAKVGDPTKWLIGKPTAVASPSGYRNITITPVLASATSPFTNGDNIVMGFVRNGDAGVSLFQDVLAGASPSSASSVVFGPLPTDKGEIIFEFGLTLSASTTLRVAFSNDNVTYGTSVALGITGTSQSGHVTVSDINGVRPTFRSDLQASATLPTSPDGVGLGFSANGMANVTGGVKYVKFLPNTGTFTGTFSQPRAR